MPVRTAYAMAAAGGAISTALTDALVKKGILTNTEAREVLSDAQNRLGPFIGLGAAGADAAEGSRIIGELMAGLPKGSS